MKPTRELRTYLTGLCATFAGAWATGETGSMVPLALGASVTVMCTVPLVRRLLRRKQA